MKNNTKNNKGNLYVIATVTVLVIIGGVLIFRGTKSKSSAPAYIESSTPTKVPSPTVSMSPTPTAPWTKLINTKYSYSIEYPSNIEEQDSALHNPEVAALVYLNDMRIIVMDSKGMSLKNFVDKEKLNNQAKDNPNLKNKYVNDIEKTVLAGIQGYQFTENMSIHFDGSSEGIKGTFKLRYIKNRNNIYLLAYPINKPVYERIAETFKPF